MAVGLLGKLYVAITGDTSHLESSIDRAKGMSETGARQMSAAWARGLVGMAQVGSTLTRLVTVPLLGIGAAAVKVASDAEETENKFREVFKESADATRKWAEEYSRSLGRSTSANLGFLATIQDTLVPLGFVRGTAAELSKTVVQLATDLSSFNNLPTEQVIRDIQSAIVGNTETLRKYGVVANEAQIQQEALTSGLVAEASEINANIKARAILNLLMKGTADAQGDAARTAAGVANQMRSVADLAKEIGVSFGRILLPAIQQLLSRIRDFARGFLDMSPAMKEAVVRLAAFAAVSGPLLLVLPKLVFAVRGLFAAFSTGAGPVGLIAVAIAGVVAGITLLSGRARDAREKQELLTKAVDGGLQAVEDYEQALKILEEQNRNGNAAFARNQKIIEDVRNQYALAEKAARAFEGGLNRSEIALVKQALAGLGMAAWMQDAVDTGRELDQVQNSLRLKLDELRQGLRATSDLERVHTEYLARKAAIEANLKKAIGDRAAAEAQALEELVRAQAEMEKATKALLEKQEAERKAEQTATKRADLEREYSDVLFEQTHTRIEVLEREKAARIAAAREAGASTLELEQVYDNLILEAGNEARTLEAEAEHAAKEARWEEEQRDAARRRGLIAETFSFIGDLAGSFSEISSGLTAGRLQELDEEYARKKAAIEANITDEDERAAALQALDDETAAKKKEIDREEAKRQKRLRIFETIINTARAIAEALPSLAKVAFATITGAAQLAAIAAQPIPAAKGLDIMTREPTLILAGDNPGGRERVTVTPESSPNIAGPGVLIEQPVVIEIDGTPVYRGLLRATQQGIALVANRAVVPG